MRTVILVAIFLGSMVSGCGDDGPCDANANSGCDDGKSCERIQGGEETTCAAPVTVEGRVFDLATNAGIGGARIVALDANSAASSFVAVSDSSGHYSLIIPTPRNPDGTPAASAQITLRADAAGYLTFPSGIRPALPFDTANPALVDGRYAIASALTDVGLLAIGPGGPATGTIRGRVADRGDGAGALVVAEVAGVGHTAVADRGGDFAIFNVPAGAADVAAYALGHNYDHATADVIADRDVEVNLALSDAATSTVSGSVQIVNGQMGTATSVILVVESTFDAKLARGETPAGLRAPQPGTAPNVTGAFSIAGVPAGRYVVLAGFENDYLVRDESSIGGTQVVHQQVTAGQDVAIAQSFKVTGSVDIVSPGANGPEMVTGTPQFKWVDDSSEDRYEVTVFNSYGNTTWQGGTLKNVVTLTYGGPPLESGMYYQVRVRSIKDPAEQISKSEELKGVFFVP
ncbi:MAG TPA: carboxypeptidase-like regulatory domain-containing protein [Kofleriaceae bacterium]|nr:carboxypeptidase-like regulatory domain-containing protein [Kofleriaceae bacterium]